MSLTDSRSPPGGAWMVAYGLALAAAAAAILAAVLFDQWVSIPNLSLIFVLPVVFAAVQFGWGPALAAAVAGVAGFNFFLIEPRYTFRVSDGSNVWALILLLVVATIVSAVAAEARRRTVEAQDHADQAAALQGLARQLVAATDRAAIVTAAAQALGQLFAAPAVVLLEDGETLALAAATAGATLSGPDLEAARWSLASRLATRSDVYPVEQARFDFWPLATSLGLQGLIGLDLGGREKGRPAAPERLVEIVGGYLAVALERERFATQAAQARLAMESERVKADLLAAVSHDLRTPLSTILFTLQSLQRFGDAHDAETRAQLLAVAEAETARLSGLVGKLLDMSRIDADAVAVRLEPAPLADLITAAAAHAQGAMAGHRLDNQIGASPLRVMIDFALAETALANVLENAAKYAPPGSVITVTAAAEAGEVVIEVRDQGPGFGAAPEVLFAKFARGIEGDGRPPGTGLGLAIARGFLEAQGGAIEAADRDEGGGGIVRIRLRAAAADLQAVT